MRKEIKEAEDAPAKMVEYRVFFTGFREVNGLTLPHHIARGAAGQDDRGVGDQELQGQSHHQGRSFKVGS